MAASSACDVGHPRPGDASRGPIPPRPRVVRVEATESYDDDGRPVRIYLSENAITEGVSPSTSIRVTFDRFLFTHRVLRQSLCLRPNTDPVASIADCGGPSQPFAEPDYDPVSRSVTYRLPTSERLVPDTLYRLTIFEPSSSDALGFFAFDGARLDRTYQLDFRTAGPSAVTRDELLPSPASYCAARSCFAPCESQRASCDSGCAGSHATCLDGCDPGEPSCPDDCNEALATCSDDCQQIADDCGAPCRGKCVEPTCRDGGDLLGGSPPALFRPCTYGGCHGPSEGSGTDGSTLAMGLDLSSLEGLRATALGVTAHQTQVGEDPELSEASPARFGRTMPLIDPGNPGNSYLVYKLLINPLNHPRSDGALPGWLDDELGRLRNAFAIGLPMPAQSASSPASGLASDDPDGVLSHQHAEAIAAWIANGAVLSCED